MLKRIINIGLIFSVFGCVHLPSSKNIESKILNPIARLSFCTFTGSETTISVVGDMWALVSSYDNARIPGTVQMHDSVLYRGKNIQHYIKKNTAKRRPLLTSHDGYSMEKIENLTLYIGQKEISAPHTRYNNAVVNDFSVGNDSYRITGILKLDCGEK